MSLLIKSFFEPQSETFSYVVTDTITKVTAIIDAVLEYDQFSGHTKTNYVDQILSYISENDFHVEWILDTHIHADHITASAYIRSKIGGKVAVGENICQILSHWEPIFNFRYPEEIKGAQFDVLLKDGDKIALGELFFEIYHTPGHTPACCCFKIEDAVFVGDTIFMPDVGTARTDFPGGDAAAMYESLRKILSFPDETRLFMCHDYPPEGRSAECMTTVMAQKKHNVMIRDGISKEAYIAMRHKRDKGKAVPKMLLPAIQANMRAGDFGAKEDNGVQYVKVPVDKL